MANYNLVVNSTFQPFSFEDYVKPYAIYGEAFKAREKELNDLEDKADMWNMLASSKIDRNTYEQYNDYSEALNKAVDNLNKNGLSSSRADLMKLKRRYNREIVPIKEAYTKREADKARQDKLRDALGGNVVFDRDAYNTSLDAYLSGEVPAFNNVNLNKLEEESILAGKSLSSKYVKTSEGRAFGGDYLTLIKEKGLSPEQALLALSNSGAYPEFDKYIKDTLESVGYDKYDDTSKERILSTVTKGLGLGIAYDKAESNVANWRSQLAARQDMYKPYEIVDEEGKSTGKYYDPRLNMVTDGKNKIYKEDVRKITSKLGAGQGGAADAEDTKILTKEGFLTEHGAKQVRGIARLLDDKNGLGYKPVGVIMMDPNSKTNKFYNDGESIAGDNLFKSSGTYLSTARGYVNIKNLGQKSIQEEINKSTLMTREELIDFIKNPINEEAFKKLNEQVEALGYTKDYDDFQYLKIPRKNDKTKFDILVTVKQPKINK